MSQEIIKVLEYLGEKLGIAIDWTTENVLPYAEQLFKRYVTLKIIYASVGTVIGIALAVIAMVLAIKMIKSYSETSTKKTNNIWWKWSSYWAEARSTELVFAAIPIAILCAIAALPTLICNISSLIEWIIIPEIPFAKEIASLLGTTM